MKKRTKKLLVIWCGVVGAVWLADRPWKGMFGMIDPLFDRSAILGAVTAAICVPLVLVFFRKARIHSASERIILDDDGTNYYKKWDVYARVVFLFFIIVLTGLIATLFEAIESWRVSLLRPADFVLQPLPIFFLLPAFFLGMLFSIVPQRRVLIWSIGKEKYEQLLVRSDRRRGINSARVMRYIAYVAVPLLAISVVLGFQTYATANQSRFIIHPYFSFHEQAYDWTDVERVTFVKSFRAPNGIIRRDLPYYVVRMRDGFELSFHRSLLEMKLPDQKKFVDFVMERSHVNLESEDPYPQKG